jgi:hypothetical protein
MRLLSHLWMPPDEESVSERISRFVHRKPMRRTLALRVYKKEKQTMIVKEPESQFIPAPAGVHAGVCVDEIDLGMVVREFGGAKSEKRMVRLVWQIAEDMKDGKPYLVKKDYTASLHEKAGLRKDLEGWRGRPFSFDELAGFDLEKVVGAPCMMNIVHATGRKGGTFANIAAIMPLAKGFVKLEPRDYVRQKDRPKVEPGTNGTAKQHVDEPPPVDFNGIDDDDVPF